MLIMLLLKNINNINIRILNTFILGLVAVNWWTNIKVIFASGYFTFHIICHIAHHVRPFIEEFILKMSLVVFIQHLVLLVRNSNFLSFLFFFFIFIWVTPIWLLKYLSSVFCLLFPSSIDLELNKQMSRYFE